MAITTKANVEKYLLTSIDSTFDSQIAQWISAVENQIDKMTDRQMIAADEDAEYAFDGTGRHEMLIPDFFTITSVEVKSEKDDVEPEDYTDKVYFYPTGRTPIYQLQMDYYHFPKGRQNIVVTGRKGYFDSAEIDDDLVFAATVMVAGIVNASNISAGEIKRETIGRYSIEYVTDQQKIDYKTAMKTISQYRRHR